MTHLSWVALRGMVHSFAELREPLHHSAGHIMRNVGLDELQAEIKIVGRNINNLR